MKTLRQSSSLLLCAPAARLVAILILVITGCRSTKVTHTTAASEAGTIVWCVQQAKVRGETKIVLADVGGTGEESTFHEALEFDPIVVAVPISSAVQVETDTIATWYKFKVLSVLSDGKKCGLPCNAPERRQTIFYPSANTR